MCVLLVLPLVCRAGPGVQGFYQSDTSKGFTQWSPLAYLINGVAHGKVSAQQEKCQGAKPVLLNVGEATIPYPWVPKVTDLGLLRLGNFVSMLGHGTGGGRAGWMHCWGSGMCSECWCRWCSCGVDMA